MSLCQLPSNFIVSMFIIYCHVMDTSCLVGRSFLFLDEKKRTKEKSRQNNAASRKSNTPSLFCRACAPELAGFDPIIFCDHKTETDWKQFQSLSCISFYLKIKGTLVFMTNIDNIQTDNMLVSLCS